MTYVYQQLDIWHAVAEHANEETGKGWELTHVFAKERPGNYLLVFRKEKGMVDVEVSAHRAEQFAHGEITFEALTGHPVADVGKITVRQESDATAYFAQADREIKSPNAEAHMAKGIDMAREAAKRHDLWKLIDVYNLAALAWQHEIDNGTSRSEEVTAKFEWLEARDALRKAIGLDVEAELPSYPHNGGLVPREYLTDPEN